MKKNLFLIIFSLSFFGIGIGFGIWGWSQLKKAKESKKWPSVNGKIISSEVVRKKSNNSKRKSSSTTYGAEIVYEYFVSEKKYSSNKISFSEYSSSDISHAQKIVNIYFPGKTVTVYYNPEDPYTAVLETGTTFVTYIPVIISVIFSIIGGVCLFILILKFSLIIYFYIKKK
jgi:hypothetical protein